MRLTNNIGNVTRKLHIKPKTASVLQGQIRVQVHDLVTNRLAETRTRTASYKVYRASCSFGPNPLELEILHIVRLQFNALKSSSVAAVFSILSRRHLTARRCGVFSSS